MKRWHQRRYVGAVIVQAWWKMKFWRKRYLWTLAASRTINRIWRGALARKRVNGLRIVNSVVEQIIDEGARVLYRRVQHIAAIEVQRHVRGHMCRCSNYDKVLKIRKAKRNFVYTKAATVIQKYGRRLITKKSIKRMNGAAFSYPGLHQDEMAVYNIPAVKNSSDTYTTSG